MDSGTLRIARVNGSYHVVEYVGTTEDDVPVVKSIMDCGQNTAQAYAVLGSYAKRGRATAKPSLKDDQDVFILALGTKVSA